MHFYLFLFLFNFLRPYVEIRAPCWNTICVRLSWTVNQFRNDGTEVSYKCLLLVQVCPTSSYNLMYSVSLHLHFAWELFTFLSFCTSYLEFGCLAATWLTHPGYFLLFLPCSLISESQMTASTLSVYPSVPTIPLLPNY